MSSPRFQSVPLVVLVATATACVDEGPLEVPTDVDQSAVQLQEVPPRQTTWIPSDPPRVWKYASHTDSTITLGVKDPQASRGVFNGTRLVSQSVWLEALSTLNDLAGVSIVETNFRYSAVRLAVRTKEAVARVSELPFVDYLEPAIIVADPGVLEPSSNIGTSSESSSCAWDSSAGDNNGYWIAADNGEKIANIFDGMGIPTAWGYSTGSGVRVGLIDTGIDYRNPDLANWTAWAVSTDSPLDSKGHGTHQGGNIGAAKNGEYFRGVAYAATFASVNHGDELHEVNGWRATDAIDTLAYDFGAIVISMALKAHDDSNLVSDAIANHYTNRDVVFAAAAGSTGLGLWGFSDVVFPADNPNVIAVGSVNYPDDTHFACSHTGHELELSAYHGQPTSGTSSEGFGNGESGNTSNSTSIVSGVVALVRARYPTLTNADVRKHLRRYARDLGNAGHDDEFGYGLIDAATSVNPPDLDIDMSGPYEVKTGYFCTWLANSSGGVGWHYSYDWYVNGQWAGSGSVLETALSARSEIKVTVRDRLDNTNTEARIVEVDESYPIGDCESPETGGEA